jgi:hypothetical protein
MPEIRSRHVGSVARADRRVPRVSGPGSLVRATSVGAPWRAGPMGRRLRQLGGGNGRGLTGGVTERSGPLISDGGHAHAQHRGRALMDGAL